MRADRPGVGGNLREHKSIAIQARLTQPYSHNTQLAGPRLLVNAARWYLFKSGSLASTCEVTGFVKTRPGLNRPDAELIFWCLSTDKKAGGMVLEKHPGIMCSTFPLRTESQGRLLARSADPTDPPILRTNQLSAEYDCRVIVGGFRYLRRILASAQVAPFIAEETHPGRDIETDDEIVDAARRDSTMAHATGTCRIGQDKDAVVDERLRVYGVTNLRVMDLSVMPTQISGNTNGPAMGMAWRGADLILEDAR